MRLPLVGNKGDLLQSPVKNADATLAGTMAVGTPVVLQLNGTDDGLAVVLPSTAGAAQTEACMYGVLTQALPYLQTGYAMRNGVVSNAVIVRATRAATTDSWSSSASIASWAALSVDTLNNGFTTVSASAGASRYQAFAVLAQSISSIAGTASATSDTRTALTVTGKVWINLL
jgi:hypothetical protein